MGYYLALFLFGFIMGKSATKKNTVNMITVVKMR